MLSPTSPIPLVKFTEHTKYCAICTPLGKVCLKEFSMSLHWDNDKEEEEEEEEKTRIKEKSKTKIVKRRHPKPTPNSLQ